jgi:ankyrin repeat protein
VTGKVGQVKKLLSDGVNVNACVSENGTALIAASIGGHLKIVKLLLRKGADVNAGTREGWTPLMCAARQGHVEIVSLLIDHGADVNARWHYPRDIRATALSMASEVKSERHLEIMNLLLDSGACISTGVEIGFTALSAASWNGNLEAVKLLLDRGAVHEDRVRALHMAAGKDHLDIIDLLVDRGVDVNSKIEYGFTALMRAAFHRNLAAAKYLSRKELTST